ncbi:MAG: hypothetical protein ACTSP4_10360 [Candidatus Hodarchaeales archaeon]
MINNNLTLLNIITIGFFFSVFEILTNMFYLISKNLDLPRKQHGAEIPVNATDQDVLMKVKQMLILGLVLLFLALMAVLVNPLIFFMGGMVILISATIDAFKFRKSKMFIIWSIIAVLVMLSSLLA